MASIPLPRLHTLSEDQVLTMEGIMAQGRKEVQAVIGRWFLGAAVGLILLTAGLVTKWNAVESKMETFEVTIQDVARNSVKVSDFDAWKVKQLESQLAQVEKDRVNEKDKDLQADFNIATGKALEKLHGMVR
jgi:hypothetical protein